MSYDQAVPASKPENGAGFAKRLVATSAEIDALGHVNNAVWVRWVQEITIAHWEAVASRDLQERYAWMVLRHEIDYRGNVAKGDYVTGETWVTAATGARLVRYTRFVGSDNELKVEATTIWVCLGRASGRPSRCPIEVRKARRKYAMASQ